MTIYRIYEQNGHRAGFWVQHRTWNNSCAQVQSIDGQCEGALVSAAVADPTQSVVMRVFDVRSGRRLAGLAPTHPPGDKNFTQIAEPYWFHQFR